MKLDVDKAEQQIYELRKTVRYDIRELTIEIIVNKYTKGLDYYPELPSESIRQYSSSLWVPEYQRDFTWDEVRQSRFIESVLLGLPIPLVFVAENSDSIWEIVDGSQRIRTLNAFMKNELTLHHLEKLTAINGFRFKDLSPSRQGKFQDLPIRMIVLTEEATDDVKKDMFERINRGSDLLKPMEKRKGIYQGQFNDFIYKRCATNDTFRKLAVIDKWLENRQEREELILRYFALSELYDKFPPKTGIAKVLDEYLDEKNKYLQTLKSPDANTYLNGLYDAFCAMLSFVERYSKYGFRNRHYPQTKRTIFEAISVGVHLALVKNPHVSCTEEKFTELLNSETFLSLTVGNVASRGAYLPENVKSRVQYVESELLKK